MLCSSLEENMEMVEMIGCPRVPGDIPAPTGHCGTHGTLWHPLFPSSIAQVTSPRLNPLANHLNSLVQEKKFSWHSPGTPGCCHRVPPTPVAGSSAGRSRCGAARGGGAGPAPLLEGPQAGSSPGSKQWTSAQQKKSQKSSQITQKKQ